MRANLVRGIVTILSALIIVFLLKNVVGITSITGSSMKPTFSDGNRILMLKYGNPINGEIVVYRYDDSKNVAVKRVIAIPGDTVEVRNGTIFLNGHKLSEEYTQPSQEGNMDPLYIADGWYFVLGDNRMPGVSLDSLDFGPIHRSKIYGRVPTLPRN